MKHQMVIEYDTETLELKVGGVPNDLITFFGMLEMAKKFIADQNTPKAVRESGILIPQMTLNKS